MRSVDPTDFVSQKRTFPVAVNRKVIDKSRDFETLATRFQNVEFTQAELAHEINNGHAFTTTHRGRRMQENFQEAGYIALDFDHATPEQQAALLNDPLVQKYLGIFYHTPSSTEDQPRFRLLFELEQFIYDPEYYRECMQAMIWRFAATADKSCKDPCRFFYGSKGSNPRFTGQVLPAKVLAQIVTDWRKAQQQEAQAKAQAARPAPGKANNPGRDKYLQKVLSNACETLRSANEGNRHYTLLKVAKTVGGFIAGENLNEDEALRELVAAYMVHNPDRKEMTDALQSGIAAGKREPLYMPPLTIAGRTRPAQPTDHVGPDLEQEGQEQEGQEKTEQKEENDNKYNSEDDNALAEYSPDDEGNADAFRSVFGDDFLFCGAYGFLAWDGTHWVTELAEAQIDKKIMEVLRRRQIAAFANKREAQVKASVANRSRINACKQALEKRLVVAVEDFDKEPELLNCKNGVVNLRTGKLTPHSKDQRFSYCVPVDYNPHVNSNVWLSFLLDVIGGGIDVIDYLQQAIGYTLTGETSEECLFYLYGPSRSGKGTFTEALLKLLGEPLATEVDFSTFVTKRNPDDQNFDLAGLKPARCVIASESTRHQSLNPAKLKLLTGGNQVRAAWKHKDLFTYRPQYKIWMVSNWPINGDTDDEALWGRLRVIEFPNSHLGTEDKSLKARIKSPEVLESILAWAVEGAILWYKTNRKGLKTPKAVTDATQAHRTEGDFVQMWLDECCQVDDPLRWTSNAQIYNNYERWCKDNGVDPKQLRGLSVTLKSKGFIIGVQTKVNGENNKGVQGIFIA